ncbi:MAG: class I SAM-dependent methyltransferase [Ruminococcaceae bacterium]|nr:class I SAM-dependent methyltransferase [Oscillospiraceae bacterium]
MDAFTALTAYYGSYDEEGRLLSRHGQVEYLTTMRYIEKYLRKGMRVLEIGAGTGRYSLALAARGYRVDAIELIRHNIDIFRTHITDGMDVTVTQGNATDLSAIADGTYDITLLLGPMYHLYTEDDQLRALSEALRVTKQGGVIFAAYCGNDATVVNFCFVKGMILNEHYRALTDFDTFKLRSNPEDLFQMYRKEDIDALMARFDTERLHYIGTDMATRYMDDTIDAMSDELFELYLKYHFVICERADMVGVSHHILDVFRKK